MDILDPGQLKIGIQDLTIFKSFVNLPDFNLFPPSTIHHYSSLRHFTLAGHGCPVAGLPLAPLSDLEILTIMQLHKRETTNQPDESPEPEKPLRIADSGALDTISEGRAGPVFQAYMEHYRYG